MSIVVKNDENHDDIMVDLVGVGGWRHTGYLSLCWHQHHFQLTPNKTLIPDCWHQKHKIPDFYTKTHQFSMFWHQANFFYTCTTHGACDKYQVWLKGTANDSWYLIESNWYFSPRVIFEMWLSADIWFNQNYNSLPGWFSTVNLRKWSKL